MRIRGLDPIGGDGAKVLLLGTLPGKLSLDRGQYYANDRNAFWFIMQELLRLEEGRDYPSRVSALCRARLAVWDVLSSALRVGSADSAIVAGSEVANDLRAFLRLYESIDAVFFNGAKAQKLFRRLVLPTLGRRGEDLRYHGLPSTSPANTHLTKAAKLAEWGAVSDALARGQADSEARGYGVRTLG